MQPTTTATDRPGARRRARAFTRQLQNGDQIAHFITFIFAAAIIVITVVLFYELYASSYLTREKFGWRFLTGTTWDPVALEFGALPFIYGTLVTSILALIIGVPLGVGAAIFLAELAPVRMSAVLAFIIELLAAVPSVIYGLLAIFTLVPFFTRLYRARTRGYAGFSATLSGCVVWLQPACRRLYPGDHDSALHHFYFS
jgi:phosphate transport system permease protein